MNIFALLVLLFLDESAELTSRGKSNLTSHGNRKLLPLKKPGWSVMPN